MSARLTGMQALFLMLLAAAFIAVSGIGAAAMQRSSRDAATRASATTTAAAKLAERLYDPAASTGPAVKGVQTSNHAARADAPFTDGWGRAFIVHAQEQSSTPVEDLGDTLVLALQSLGANGKNDSDASPLLAGAPVRIKTQAGVFCAADGTACVDERTAGGGDDQWHLFTFRYLVTMGAKFQGPAKAPVENAAVLQDVTSARRGDLRLSIAEKQLYLFDGTEWRPVSGDEAASATAGQCAPGWVLVPGGEMPLPSTYVETYGSSGYNTLAVTTGTVRSFCVMMGEAFSLQRSWLTTERVSSSWPTDPLVPFSTHKLLPYAWGARNAVNDASVGDTPAPTHVPSVVPYDDAVSLCRAEGWELLSPTQLMYLTAVLGTVPRNLTFPEYAFSEALPLGLGTNASPSRGRRNALHMGWLGGAVDGFVGNNSRNEGKEDLRGKSSPYGCKMSRPAGAELMHHLCGVYPGLEDSNDPRVVPGPPEWARRTLMLPNGGWVWDLYGNASEWLRADHAGEASELADYGGAMLSRTPSGVYYYTTVSYPPHGSSASDFPGPAEALHPAFQQEKQGRRDPSYGYMRKTSAGFRCVSKPTK